MTDQDELLEEQAGYEDTVPDNDPRDEESTEKEPECETDAPEDAEDTDNADNADTPKQANGFMIAVICLLSAAIVVLGILLIRGSSKKKEPAPETVVPEQTAAEPAQPSGQPADSEEDVLVVDPSEEANEGEPIFTAKVSYMKTPEEVLAAADETVAECGSFPITNRELSIIYWQGFYSVVNYYYTNYGNYMSYIINPYSELDKQSPDGENSWDELLMEQAFSQYGDIAALYTEALRNGYQLPPEEQEYFDALGDDLTDTALTMGYESADAYLADTFGPHVTVDDYLQFEYKYLLATDYCTDYVDGISFAAEDMEAFFDEHAEEYAANGVEKNNDALVDVRHILIMPEAVSLAKEDEGYQAAVDAADLAAKELADRIYAEWLAGEKTEDSFAALAGQYSQDPGSVSNGGLYEEVYPGQMVTEFNDWCFDDARVIGDTGIVETSYGYHIMFFVGADETPYWQTVVDADLHNRSYNIFLDSLVELYPVTSYMDKACVTPCNLAEQ